MVFNSFCAPFDSVTCSWRSHHPFVFIFVQSHQSQLLHDDFNHGHDLSVTWLGRCTCKFRLAQTPVIFLTVNVHFHVAAMVLALRVQRNCACLQWFAALKVRALTFVPHASAWTICHLYKLINMFWTHALPHITGVTVFSYFFLHDPSGYGFSIVLLVLSVMHPGMNPPRAVGFNQQSINSINCTKNKNLITTFSGCYFIVRIPCSLTHYTNTLH